MWGRSPGVRSVPLPMPFGGVTLAHGDFPMD